MSDPAVQPETEFRERPTEFIVRDGFVLGALPLALAGIAASLGWIVLGGILLATASRGSKPG